MKILLSNAVVSHGAFHHWMTDDLKALGHDVSPTNLRRVLIRRGLLTPTGQRRDSSRAGGRPAALFRFDNHALAITDQFAVLRPPGRPTQPS